MWKTAQTSITQAGLQVVFRTHTCNPYGGTGIYLFDHLKQLMLHLNKYSMEIAVHKLKCVKSLVSVQKSDVPRRS